MSNDKFRTEVVGQRVEVHRAVNRLTGGVRWYWQLGDREGRVRYRRKRDAIAAGEAFMRSGIEVYE
mgnify:FL=1